MVTLVLFLPEDGAREAIYLVVGDDGRVSARGVAAAGDRLPAPIDRTILAVPGEAALTRWIALPTRVDHQARVAAGFLLEDELAAGRANTHIAVAPPGESDQRLVVAVDKAQLSAWLEDARTRGAAPDIVTPDCLLLPPPEDGSALSAPIGRRVAIRAADLAVTGEPDLASLILGDRPVRALTEEAEVEAAFAAGARAPVINLLQGEFAPRREDASASGRLRLTAWLVAGALLAPLLLQGFQIPRYEAAAARARIAAESAARSLSLEAANSADPVAFARARLLQGRASGGFLPIAANVFAALEQQPAIVLASMAYRSEGALTLRVTAPDYAAIEALQEALRGRGAAVTEGASRTLDGRIETELTVRPQ